jgi:hypothetical protein
MGGESVKCLGEPGGSQEEWKTLEVEIHEVNYNQCNLLIIND